MRQVDRFVAMYTNAEGSEAAPTTILPAQSAGAGANTRGPTYIDRIIVSTQNMGAVADDALVTVSFWALVTGAPRRLIAVTCRFGDTRDLPNLCDLHTGPIAAAESPDAGANALATNFPLGIVVAVVATAPANVRTHVQVFYARGGGLR